MDKALIIFGGWFFGRVVAETAELLGWSVMGFVEPEPPAHLSPLRELPVDAAAIVAIGNNALRQAVHQELARRGRRIVTIVHPTAAIAKSAILGDGCYIAEHATVRTHSVVGAGTILNSGAVVSHDCEVGAFATFGPNAATSGHVVVGPRTLLGTGSSVRPHVRIGADCAVAPGSAVMHDLADAQAAVGVPARATAIASGPGKQSDWTSNTVW